MSWSSTSVRSTPSSSLAGCARPTSSPRSCRATSRPTRSRSTASGRHHPLGRAGVGLCRRRLRHRPRRSSSWGSRCSASATATRSSPTTLGGRRGPQRHRGVRAGRTLSVRRRLDAVPRTSRRAAGVDEPSRCCGGHRPPGSVVTAATADSPVAAMEDPERGHLRRAVPPRGRHTPRGQEILKHFLYEVCHARPTVDPRRHHRAGGRGDSGRRRHRTR